MATKLAAVPAGSMVDPCCCGCWAKFHDTMLATVTGVALCGCFIVPGTPDRFFSATGWTGVNGADLPLTAVSPGDPTNTGWSGTIGTITLQEFDGTSSPPSAVCDGTPIGAPFTTNVTMEVECFASEGLGLQADITTDLLSGTSRLIFASTDFSPPTYFQPGDIVPNIVACTTNISGYYVQVATGGQLTITPP